MEHNLNPLPDDTIYISGFDGVDAGIMELDKVPKVVGVACQG
jgi:hypothetical protein